LIFFPSFIIFKEQSTFLAKTQSVLRMEQIKKEIANSVSHGFGLALAVCGVPLLLWLGYKAPTPLHFISAGIFGISLFMVYLSSTLYHSIQHARVKRIFRIFDHISIYFLIAGSYTPFVLLFLDKSFGMIILTTLWCIVAIGTVFKFFYVERFDRLSTVIYVLMGWGALAISGPMIDSLPLICIIWIVVGGLFYTFGTIFYFWKGIRYHHFVWHLFVLAGSACHYIAVALALML